MSVGVRTRSLGFWGTGIGPAVVREPPFCARPLLTGGTPLLRSAIDAASSAVTGVKEYGVRMASSRAKIMADAVRLEIRIVRCGQNADSVESRTEARGAVEPRAPPLPPEPWVGWACPRNRLRGDDPVGSGRGFWNCC